MTTAEPARRVSMELDPAVNNPEHYAVVFENQRVRVLEYAGRPGDRTTPHQHPDSVMYTLTSFRRRLVSDGEEREVEMAAGTTAWLPAQTHHGVNIGDTANDAAHQHLGPAGINPASH